jgi:hypothetical protein
VQKKKVKKKKTQPKTPLTPKEALEKIKTIRGKLQDMKEYKAILAEDGMKPDEEDKRRESELIIQLLRLEKQAGIKKEKPKSWRGKKPAGKKKTGSGGAGKKSGGGAPGKKPGGRSFSKKP